MICVASFPGLPPSFLSLAVLDFLLAHIFGMRLVFMSVHRYVLVELPTGFLKSQVRKHGIFIVKGLATFFVTS